MVVVYCICADVVVRLHPPHVPHLPHGVPQENIKRQMAKGSCPAFVLFGCSTTQSCGRDSSLSQAGGKWDEAVLHDDPSLDRSAHPHPQRVPLPLRHGHPTVHLQSPRQMTRPLAGSPQHHSQEVFLYPPMFSRSAWD